MKEDTNMKKNILAMLLLIVMIFSLTACGQQAAAPAEATADVAAPAEATADVAAPVEEPATEEQQEIMADATIVDAPTSGSGIEPDTGEYTLESEAKGFSIRYDSKYVASELPGSGNIKIDANMDLTAIPGSIPYVTVALYDKEAAGDAASFLRDTATAVKETSGKSLVTEPKEPTKYDLGSRDIYYIYYTYKDTETNEVVASAVWAENLSNGQVAVYNSLAPQEDSSAVEAILNLAITSFTLTK